jgi:hypothetical protein
MHAAAVTIPIFSNLVLFDHVWAFPIITIIHAMCPLSKENVDDYLKKTPD